MADPETGAGAYRISGSGNGAKLLIGIALITTIMLAGLVWVIPSTLFLLALVGMIVGISMVLTSLISGKVDSELVTSPLLFILATFSGSVGVLFPALGAGLVIMGIIVSLIFLLLEHSEKYTMNRRKFTIVLS